MEYPKSIYNPQGAYKVVFGPEEHAAAKREGWTDELQNDKSARITLGELIESAPASTFVGDNSPKRRGRPPKVQQITEVA